MSLVLAIEFIKLSVRYGHFIFSMWLTDISEKMHTIHLYENVVDIGKIVVMRLS